MITIKLISFKDVDQTHIVCWVQWHCGVLQCSPELPEEHSAHPPQREGRWRNIENLVKFSKAGGHGIIILALSSLSHAFFSSLTPIPLLHLHTHNVTTVTIGHYSQCFKQLMQLDTTNATHTASCNSNSLSKPLLKALELYASLCLTMISNPNSQFLW